MFSIANPAPFTLPGLATCQNPEGGAGEAGLGRWREAALRKGRWWLRTRRRAEIFQEELAEPGARAIARSGAPSRGLRGQRSAGLRRAPPRTARDSAGGSSGGGSCAPLGVLRRCGHSSAAPRHASYLLILSTNARRSVLGSVAIARRRLVGL